MLRRAIVLVVAALIAACKDQGPPGPPAVASVTVSSPIGDRLAVGRAVRLTAIASDASGVAVTVPFTWRSSTLGVATVDATGLVTGESAGNATISAEAGGVAGSVALRFSAVDLDAIHTALVDPLMVTFWEHLTPEVHGRLGGVLASCVGSTNVGNLTAIEACVTASRTETAAAVDPGDRALLATMALFLDFVERLVNG